MTHGIDRQPLREGGPFTTETYCIAKLDDYNYQQIKFTVVYADNCKASHCQWMVPGTWTA
jgi:hypothetical protein